VTVPGFDYAAKPEARLEIPIHERIAAARAARGAGRRGAPPKGKPHAAHAKPRPKGGRGRSRLDAILDKHAPKR